uniref:Mediator of RNA polymerase II transcription subunit 29 n=1 Tax=Sphenodon punctatus TaxID=8508 RepID=A0A8D0H3G2_SPHPU
MAAQQQQQQQQQPPPPPSSQPQVPVPPAAVPVPPQLTLRDVGSVVNQTQVPLPGQSGVQDWGGSRTAQAQVQDFDPVQRYKYLLPQLKESVQGPSVSLLSRCLAAVGDWMTSSRLKLNPDKTEGMLVGWTDRLIPPLLENLMKVASQNLLQNTNIDNGQKSNDGAVQRFDKSLEEFYALCDQLELCLRLAYECLSQSFDSAKHSPNLVPTATKPDTVQAESLPYSQYLNMIKSQISCAKDIHNALLECSNKITGKPVPRIADTSPNPQLGSTNH